MKKTVLFAHQSAELYGSDKVFLYLLEGLADSYIAIALLPEEGPLCSALKKIGVEVHIIPLVKISRKSLSFSGILRLPIEIFVSYTAIEKAVGGRRIDLVYTNTVAIVAAAFWAKLKGVQHLWHVHEIILQPWIVKRMFPFMIRLFAHKVICNSAMSRAWIVAEQPSLASRSKVIWNGQGSRPMVDIAAVRGFEQAVNRQVNEVVVALVGRVNKWKGQSILIDAASLLWNEGVRNIRFVLVGGPAPGAQGQVVLQSMLDRMMRSPASSSIVWIDFMSDVWSVWDSCDIAVVPSTDPEPFGMVAIEAMASSKAVVASAHGGLVEIVSHGETGLLVEPGNPRDLADAVKKLVSSPSLRKEFGENGKRRQALLFSLSEQVEQTRSLIESMLSQRCET